MGKAARILIHSSIPSGGNFIFADFETPQCQFCTKMPEMSDLCYLGKTRINTLDTTFTGYQRLTNTVTESTTQIVTGEGFTTQYLQHAYLIFLQTDSVRCFKSLKLFPFESPFKCPRCFYQHFIEEKATKYQVYEFILFVDLFNIYKNICVLFRYFSLRPSAV